MGQSARGQSRLETMPAQRGRAKMPSMGVDGSIRRIPLNKIDGSRDDLYKDNMSEKRLALEIFAECETALKRHLGNNITGVESLELAINSIIRENQRSGPNGLHSMLHLAKELPPNPRQPYTKHWKNPQFGVRLPVVRFLTEVWGDLTTYHLLYSAHLQKLDAALYQAILYHARGIGREPKELMLDLGIMTMDTIKSPPPGLEEAAKILAEVLMRTSKLGSNMEHKLAASRTSREF